MEFLTIPRDVHTSQMACSENGMETIMAKRITITLQRQLYFDNHANTTAFAQR